MADRIPPSPGFTLLEMTIVIVIIALIAGGILSGRQMMINAQMQSIIRDVDRFRKAGTLFHDKYRYLPGDLPNATSFWGTDSACPDGDPILKKETCDGNGNGQIGGVSPGSYPCPTDVDQIYREPLRAWQQMANAGLIDGSYSGTANSAGQYQAGVNVPRGADEASGYILFYSATLNRIKSRPNNERCDGAYPGRYGHIIAYGRVSETDVTEAISAPSLSAVEASFIDHKTDDGIPSSGYVMSLSTTNCASAILPPAVYKTTSEPSCVLIFKTGF